MSLVLLFASAGVLDHSGIKIPFFSFFAHDSGLRPKEAPWNMLLAMGITAFLCIAIGVYPAPLYALLPYEVDYVPYTTTHVVTQLQLLFFSALAFTVLMRTGIYPPELKSVNLDTDWSYRRMMPAVIWYLGVATRAAYRGVTGWVTAMLEKLVLLMYHSHGPDGARAAQWPTGAMVLNIAIVLGITLLVIFFA